MPNVVLVQPQIPPNTGSVARTCAATRTELHLVGELGFEISDRYLKRAGLDYWPYVDWHYHPDWAQFQAHRRQAGGRAVGLSASRGAQNYTHYAFAPNDWLLFGSETDGLPDAVLAACDTTLYIPIQQPQVRSFNLSVSVAIVLFEAQRQLGRLA